MGVAAENMNVLVIEDDDVDVIGVKRAFRDVKLSNPIIVASNGREALKKLRAGEVAKPYMVLLDLNMPLMNGFEFLEELRADKDLKDTIIFVLSTSNDIRDQKRAYDHNIAGYIVKSGGSDSFLNTAALFDQYARTVKMI